MLSKTSATNRAMTSLKPSLVLPEILCKFKSYGFSGSSKLGLLTSFFFFVADVLDNVLELNV